MKVLRNALKAVTVFSIFFTSLAHSAPLSAFGLELGLPFSAPACIGNEQFPPHPKESYCLVVSSKNPLKKNENGTSGQAKVLFKYNDLPFWTSDEITVQLVNGKLEGIIVKTGGQMTHLSVTADLTKKYGNPTTTSSQEVQNQLGNRFDNSIMFWQIEQASVMYTPIFGNIKAGRIEIFTKTGLEAYKQTLVELDKSPARPL